MEKRGNQLGWRQLTMPDKTAGRTGGRESAPSDGITLSAALLNLKPLSDTVVEDLEGFVMSLGTHLGIGWLMLPPPPWYRSGM